MAQKYFFCRKIQFIDLSSSIWEYWYQKIFSFLWCKGGPYTFQHILFKADSQQSQKFFDTIQVFFCAHEIKFIYSEKATKFCEIFTLLLTDNTTQDKSKVKISQNYVAFSEYMNFKYLLSIQCSILGFLYFIHYLTKKYVNSK